MVKFRILSLDSGGIRGILTAVLLERLEEAYPGFLSMVDLFAGSSTGGILALGLAAGKTPSEAACMYERDGPEVFADSLLDDLKDAGNAFGAEYTNAGLKHVLQAEFGEQTLGQLPRRVLISSFDLDNGGGNPRVLDGQRTWKPKFFHNFPGPGSDGDEKVVDVALRTSAAPSYFPVYQGYIDGGVVANNPSMCALAQTLDAGTGGRRLTQVALLSVGTGRYARHLNAQSADWGWTQWARPLIDIMLEGSVDVPDYQAARLLGRRYQRIDPVLPEPIDLGDLAQIPRLKELAARVDIRPAVTWLKKNFQK
ncbi:MAG TPA: patatin-like phospholipase family protein [Anaerolineales bacterium]|nr:patatin-like phospholipase family protein [Anaerolineales bacterium]